MHVQAISSAHYVDFTTNVCRSLELCEAPLIYAQLHFLHTILNSMQSLIHLEIKERSKKKAYCVYCIIFVCSSTEEWLVQAGHGAKYMSTYT